MNDARRMLYLAGIVLAIVVVVALLAGCTPRPHGRFVRLHPSPSTSLGGRR